MKKQILNIGFNISLIFGVYLLSHLLCFIFSNSMISIFTKMNIYNESIISFQFGNFLFSIGISFLVITLIHFFKIRHKQNKIVSNFFEIIYLLFMIYYFVLFTDYVSTNSLPQWFISQLLLRQIEKTTKINLNPNIFEVKLSPHGHFAMLEFERTNHNSYLLR